MSEVEALKEVFIKVNVRTIIMDVVANWIFSFSKLGDIKKNFPPCINRWENARLFVTLRDISTVIKVTSINFNFIL